LKPIFIVATGTNVGKTYTTLKLIDEFTKLDISVGVYKPIETGVVNVPSDAMALLESCQKVNRRFTDLTTLDVTSYLFELPAAPFCADTNSIIDIQSILTKSDNLGLQCDLLLIESAGGLMTPITSSVNTIDLIKLFDAKVLLVTTSRLGCINDTLLCMEALNSREIAFEWCVNIHDDRDNFDIVTKPYYDAVLPNWWSVQDGLEKYVHKTQKELKQCQTN